MKDKPHLKFNIIYLTFPGTGSKNTLFFLNQIKIIGKRLFIKTKGLCQMI